MGGSLKGFHVVALRAGAYLGHFSSKSPDDIFNWSQSLGAAIVAVDAPCKWSTTGRARKAERELMKSGVSCYSTPEQKTAESHPKDQFGWVINGMRLYDRFAASHQLYLGFPRGRTQQILESYPHGVACALAGKIVSARRKSTVRRKILHSVGIDDSQLTNIDYVDACLCAITAERLLIGKSEAFGDSEEGFIVIPRRTEL